MKLTEYLLLLMYFPVMLLTLAICACYLIVIAFISKVPGKTARVITQHFCKEIELAFDAIEVYIKEFL